MTLHLITGNAADGWWVGQHARGVRPTGQAVNDERWRQWWKKGRKKIMVEEKGTHCTWKGQGRERDWIPLRSHAKWSTRMDDFDTIFANSIQFCFLGFIFFYCSFSKEQRWRTDSVWWMKSLGLFVLDCDIRWKYEDTSLSLSCEGLDFTWRALNVHTPVELCDNRMNLYWSCHWAFIKSSMLFFHTAYCTAA